MQLLKTKQPTQSCSRKKYNVFMLHVLIKHKPSELVPQNLVEDNHNKTLIKLLCKLSQVPKKLKKIK